MKRRLLCAFALLACAAFAPAASAQEPVNLVTNPGFETGDFTGWTLAGGDDNSSFVGSFDVEDGMYAAALFASSTGSSLSQTLTTTPGGVYDLGFGVAFPEAESSGVSPFELTSTLTAVPEFQAYFGGVLVYDTATVDPLPTDGSYTQIDVPGLGATAGSTTLEFDFVNNTTAYFLDDVSVVPEPASTCWIAAGALAGLGWLRVSRRRRAVAG